ncbi:MAG: family 1 encapsulin nanocompartment shell protein [Planctomycetota bacterium]
MSTKLLNRAEAPFGDAVWTRLDAIVTASARERLTGRRLLPLEGPHGLGLASVAGPEHEFDAGGEEGIALSAAVSTPLVMVRTSFALAAREIAAFEDSGLPFDGGPPARAAAACAVQEDALVFGGSEALGFRGLMSAEGVRSIELGSWEGVGAAVEDVSRAVTELDRAGITGPHALVLSPARYNALFRRYPDSGGTELEHMRELVTEGIHKSTAVGGGGVLVATVEGPNAIVLGQDLATSYVGPSGRDYGFAVSETVALRLGLPEAVCVLR